MAVEPSPVEPSPVELDEEREEIAVEIQLPFASLPYAARMELNEELLSIWEFVDDGGDKFVARRMLLNYLRTPQGQQAVNSGSLVNSYMYHVLQGKAGLLAGVLKRMDDKQNKGLFWFAQGLLRIYENKSAQASSNFAKGIFSALQLEASDYQRLSASGLEVKYFPSMTSYSNAAFIAGRFSNMTYHQQQQVVNVALAEKVAEMDVLPSELPAPGSLSYQLQALYYNLGAFLVLESHNDLFGVQGFSDQPEDLFNILKAKFGYDSREIFQRY